MYDAVRKSCSSYVEKDGKELCAMGGPCEFDTCDVIRFLAHHVAEEVAKMGKRRPGRVQIRKISLDELVNIIGDGIGEPVGSA